MDIFYIFGVVDFAFFGIVADSVLVFLLRVAEASLKIAGSVVRVYFGWEVSSVLGDYSISNLVLVHLDERISRSTWGCYNWDKNRSDDWGGNCDWKWGCNRRWD